MGDQKMLRDVSDMLTKILLESALTKRIGVAFDDYRQVSIKNLEEEKRGIAMGNEYRGFQREHRVNQWRDFLSVQRTSSTCTLCG